MVTIGCQPALSGAIRDAMPGGVPLILLAYEVDDAVRTLSIALVTPILGIAVDGLAAELLQHGPASENLSR